MAKDAFCYTFRFCCDPGFNDKTEREALLQYVEQADIDDVAVFANVEEINTGHMKEEEQQVYIDMMRTLQPLLAEKGITLSVNQWHSIMHADLGKKLHADQHFRRMVDVDGRTAELCVCPMDAEWRTYITGVYARYAKALHPEILWVEDDFRYHNHEPLHWGGCFCEAHMKLYSLKAGHKLTREDFIAGVLQPGGVHPYRKIWLDVCNEVLCDTAELISQAVHAQSPSTKLGLMSSAPHIHAAEGRRWQQLLSAFAGKNAPVNRIHLPGYQEPAAWQYLLNFNMVSMACRAFLAPDTLVYPELENYPYSRFAKSARFTRFQLLSALPLDMAGITIDLYDLNGNGIVWQEGYQHMLHQTKPYLNALTESGVFRAPRSGVCVLVNEQAAYALHTQSGADMEELYPQEVFFAGLLPAMGVPYRYCTTPDISGEVVAVSGQYLRALSAAQIHRLFADNFVLMNGDAAYTLWEMGLGKEAGIQQACWHAQNNGDVTYEQITNGKVYAGMPAARASAVISSADTLEITYSDTADVQEISAFYSSFRTRAFAAQTLVNNGVMIIPFGRFTQALDIPPMLLNTVRQEMLHEVLRTRLPAPLVACAPYLAPTCSRKDGAMQLYLVNASTDDVPQVNLLWAGIAPAYVTVQPSHGAPYTAACTEKDGSLTVPVQIPSLEAALLTFE